MHRFQYIFREISRRKARTSVAIAGYALAVAMCSLLLAIFYASKESGDNVLANTGTHFIAFVPARVSDAATSVFHDDTISCFLNGGIITRTMSCDVLDSVKTIPSIADASPFLMFRVKSLVPVNAVITNKIDSEQDLASLCEPCRRAYLKSVEPMILASRVGPSLPATSNYSLTVGGFDPANKVAVGTTCCAETDVISGRFLRPGDKGMILVEEAYARAMGLKSGDSIKIAGRAFKVAGIVNPGIRPAKADVYLPYEEAEDMARACMTQSPPTRIMNAILVQVRHSLRQEEAIRAVRKLIPDIVVSSYACYRPAAKVIGINEKTAWILVAVLQLGAILFAVKSQTASLVERRRDIGILKVLGWTNGAIAGLIFTEAAFQAFVGSLIGCVGAILLLLLLPKDLIGILNLNSIPVIAYVMIGIVCCLSMLGGIMAGIFPVLHAGRLLPLEALRRL
ncbi:MAG: FtsX-like permease family protein [Verrucomicrobia bacterium]|nr:FtsX-like permease family protein [Verrucomicrobiota bacterium]MBU4246961.1 FtsX-like permease family protein [Verrucomicrobiota bacterium]MBU4291331.1 FtsX-like permease family protein [Verrucomicrobiota bacterium]MBU4498092.1 FtsX-like permease family protein [Verrucomicrobiota bacterium]MCG2680033.1 FtsX-like permease family protein [Kiritimatiellia bacterium]